MSAQKIGYIRVSTREQAEHGLSVEAQRQHLTDAGCSRVFVDAGVSGRQTSRPEFDRMLDSLREGDTVVVWKLDRLGRDAIHLQQTARALKDQHVGFESITEPFLNTGASGVEFMFGLFALMAQMESDKISERTKMGLEEARRQGKKLGGRATVTADNPRVKLAAELNSKGRNAAEIGDALARKFGGNAPARQTVYRYLEIARQAA